MFVFEGFTNSYGLDHVPDMRFSCLNGIKRLSVNNIFSHFICSKKKKIFSHFFKGNLYYLIIHICYNTLLTDRFIIKIKKVFIYFLYKFKLNSNL